MRIKEIIKEYRKRIIKKEKEKEVEQKKEKREWRRVSPRRGKENGVESAHAEFEHQGVESGHVDVWAADVVPTVLSRRQMNKRRF